MDHSPSSRPYRKLGWNGITLNIPDCWEAIVSGSNHLLLEYDFLPVMEIRWQDTKGLTSKGVLKGLHQGFSKQTGMHLSEVQLPHAFQQNHSKLNAFSLEEGKLDGVFWQVFSPDQTFICFFHHHHLVANSQLAEILASVEYTAPRLNTSYWSIQDFRCILPAGYTLTDFTFAAGLSRLGFRGHTLHLQYCRLAPADERLSKQSLTELAYTLLGVGTDGTHCTTITSDEHAYECQSMPTMLQQILIRLRRRKPFYWVRVQHDPRHNRLLAVTAESLRPINLETVQHLCTSYEILPTVTTT